MLWKFHFELHCGSFDTPIILQESHLDLDFFDLTGRTKLVGDLSRLLLLSVVLGNIFLCILRAASGDVWLQVQYNTTLYNTTQYVTTHYKERQPNTKQPSTTQCNTTEYNTTQYNTT